MAEYVQPCDYQPITIIELVLDRDADGVSYNDAPDKCAWQCVPTSYWFSDCKAPPQIQAATVPVAIMPIISSYTPRCSVVDFSRGVSERARVSVCFHDLPIDCTGQTPGNFWSILDAEQKYWENRKLIVYQGDCTQTLDEMSKQVFFIDDVSPDGDCKYCVTAKDPLSLLSDAPVPASCLGADQVLTIRDKLYKDIEVLNEDTGDVSDPFEYVGSFILSANYPAGDPIIDDWWRCIRFICVDSEVMEVVAIKNDASNPLVPDRSFGPPGWNLVLVQRAACGSERSDISAGTRVAVVESFAGCHVADAVLRLLTKLSNVSDTSLTCCGDEPAVTIDCDSIEEFRCKNPLAIINDTLICESDNQNVAGLLEELAAENFFVISYDANEGTIKLVCLNPGDVPTGGAFVVNECDIVRGTMRNKSKTERYSRVEVLHDTLDCSKGTSESNFGPGTYFVDTDTENPVVCERVKYRTPKTKKWRSRWMGSCGAYLASTYAARICMLFNCPRERFSFQVMPSIACFIATGDLIQLNHSKKQNALGQTSETYYFVTGMCRTGQRQGCVEIHVEELFDPDDTPFPCFQCGDPPGDNLTGGGEPCTGCKPMW